MSFKTCFNYALNDVWNNDLNVLSRYLCAMCECIRVAFFSIFVICAFYADSSHFLLCYTLLSSVNLSHSIARYRRKSISIASRLCRFVLANWTLVQHLNYKHTNERHRKRIATSNTGCVYDVVNTHIYNQLCIVAQISNCRSLEIESSLKWNFITMYEASRFAWSAWVPFAVVVAATSVRLRLLLILLAFCVFAPKIPLSTYFI